MTIVLMGCETGSSTPTPVEPPVAELPDQPIIEMPEPVVDTGVNNSPYELPNIGINNTHDPLTRWLDSYSIVADNGKEYCFIDSTLDHNVGALTIVLPEGGAVSVEEAFNLQGIHPFYRERTEDVDPIYNDVQCGNGPANDFGDESVDQCPGRVDMGAGGCAIQGPRFTFVE